MRFKDEFQAYCGGGDVPTSVTINGKAYLPPEGAPAGV